MKGFLVTKLEELLIDAHIGVSEEERKSPQKIKISFKLYQKNLEAVEDDDSSNYTCYTKISKFIQQYCAENSFKLLEFLCYQIHKLIKRNVPEGTFVYVKIEKRDILCEGLKFNAGAEYSDF